MNRWVTPSPAAYARVIEPGVWPTSPITSSDSSPSGTESPDQTPSGFAPVASAMASTSGAPATRRAPVALRDPGERADVIVMAMGGGDHGDGLVADELEQPVLVIGGIDQHRTALAPGVSR